MSEFAFNSMRRERTCPPLSVLRKGGAAVEAHLRGCPYCRDVLANSDDYARMAEIVRGLGIPSLEPSPVARGDIRRVEPATDPTEWWDGDGSYRRPPRVLVLTEPNAEGFVMVSQIHDEPELSGDGDIHLIGDEIAETWNVYSLPVSGLNPRCGRRVDAATCDAVAHRAEGVFADIKEGSPLFQFRLMELATGSFFSLPLCGEALERLEAK